ncbi:hypothetical protein [Allocoleopsis sp.]|uniref:hypothetical protein n=1 Tax=Allocoleopsis sp. TaxID=3088169 RepID=UPI002FD1C704
MNDKVLALTHLLTLIFNRGVSVAERSPALTPKTFHPTVRVLLCSSSFTLQTS